ncbi:MAG TPA: hypothetical protein VIJ28_04835 [Chloroflexota bacterium]|jgi:hypothetical protein
MGTLNTWVGAIGGTILVLELIVALILLVALNGVLFFALRWVLRKQGLAHEKITWAQGHVDRLVNKGAGLAAAPVIRVTSAWRGLKAATHRATHWPKTARPAAQTEPSVSQDGRRVA